MNNEVQETINFFENEIKQHKIAMGGILRKEYSEYLIKKIKYYQTAIKAIEEYFYGETKEG